MANNFPLPDEPRDRRTDGALTDQEGAPPDREGDVPPSQEASLLNMRTLLIAAGLLVGMIAFVHLVSAGIFFLYSRLGEPLAEPPRETLPAGGEAGAPLLQVDPAGDLARLRATEQARISTYGYSDEEGRKVRIPIDKAMEWIAGGGQGPQPEAPPAEGEEPPQGEPGPAEAGQALFSSRGCAACHTAEDTDLAPTLVGLAGEQVALEDGRTVTADEAYLRESILHPLAAIVAGYAPVMPSFEGQLSDEELDALIAYIQSLGDG